MQSSIVAGNTVYVKNGTYSGGSSAFTPTNSGTVNAPIAYRAYMPTSGARHRPTLTRTGSDPAGSNRPVISSSNRNYIIWDGFTLGPWTNAEAYGSVGNRATGNIFENLIIDKGSSTPNATNPCGNGNYTGIFLQLTSYTTVRNNIIRNVNYVNCTAENATGMTIYDNDNAHIHNNEIYNTNTGISDKENGESNIHELNYMHDISGAGVKFQGYVTNRCGACSVQNNTVRNNVMVNVDIGVNFNLGDPTLQRNIDVYNNTFYNTRIGFAMSAYGAIPDTDVYNNIMVISGVGSYKNIALPAPPADWVSNYNLFRTLNNGTIQFSAPSGTLNLTQWQALGASYDPISIVSDPMFVGIPINTPQSYTLQTGSPARNAGRVGGVSSGVVVNIGAYATGNEVIGISVSTPTPSLRGDFNSDGRVNATDLTSLRSVFQATNHPPQDLNNNGIVDVRDVGILMSLWRP